MKQTEVDVAVIGAGTAGLAAYRAAKAAGKTVVMIESGPYGTTCARVGCMPSKLMIAPAEAAHMLERLPAFGMRVDAPLEIDGRAVMRRVQSERDRFVGFVTRGVDEIPEADRLVGRATFIDDHRLAIDDGTTVRAQAIVIATGSTPNFPPPWKSLGDCLVTNDQIFEFPDLPGSVAVFGPGVIGLELGQALHRLGVRVKVFGRGGGIGAIGDPAILDAARTIIGGEIYLDTNAHANVHRDGNEVVVEFKDLDGVDRVERFDYLLAATGRTPNVHHLGIEQTTLACNAHGVPLFDRETMQCGESSIFIAGDVNNDVPVLHEAADEGRIAGDNAARFPAVRKGLRRAPIAVMFTDPQIAMVGNGYRGAREVAHVVGVASFADQGRSRVMLRNQGLLHVYAEIGSGRFLGAEMVGPDAEHIAHLLAWALQMRCTIAQMLEMPFYHPVIEEGLRTALRDAQAKLDEAVPVRRVA